MDKAFIQARIKIDENGCWLWQASKANGGYGQLGLHGKIVRAHRYAYGVYVGPIPTGQLVCHKCDQPSCVNPEHLFLGTHRDNLQDMSNKRRGGSRRSTKFRTLADYFKEQSGHSRIERNRINGD